MRPYDEPHSEAYAVDGPSGGPLRRADRGANRVKRYVIVQESQDGSGERGVDAVYPGPGGVGWESRHAGMALKALRTWMDEVPPLNETTRLVVVPLDRMPDRARELMAADEERSTRLVLVESVDPPVTELWDQQAEEGK